MHSAFTIEFEQYEKKEMEKTWAYVGRFIWSFAHAEEALNELIEIYFNLNRLTWVLLIFSLDLRKRLQLIELAFKYEQISENNLISILNELHDVRNLLAHHRFKPDYGNNDHSMGAGIEFDWFNPKSKANHPKFASEGESGWAFVSYSQFDIYDLKMLEAKHRLKELMKNVKPMTQVSSDFLNIIEEAIQGSDNISKLMVRKKD